MADLKPTVRCGTVDIPKTLYDAHMSGKLVVFAGAGVSMASPSNLPSFSGLANIIASGMTCERVGGETEDRWIGRIEERSVNVRKITRDIILNPESKPTRLHKSILSLFRRVDDVKIVTTNYDPHFSTACKEVFGECPQIYCSPALPLGHNFSGIAYLHGSIIHRNWQEIVLTDRDFGKAYITQGWATRFLQDLFLNYTVLFVGYSHSDFIVNYLTRGLSTKNLNGRYIITDKGNEDIWPLLGVSPIKYQLLGNSDPDRHSPVPEALEVWAQHLSWEASEHEKYIESIVSRSPPHDDFSLDRVRFILEREDLCQYFFAHADSKEWLDWVEREGYLVEIFEEASLSSKSAMTVHWLVEKYAFQSPDLFLNLVARKNYQNFSHFWRFLASGLSFGKKPEISDKNFHIYLQFLLGFLPTKLSFHELDYLLKSCRSRTDKSSACLLFIKLTEPRLKVSVGSRYDPTSEGMVSSVDADLNFLGDDHKLRASWESDFKPNLSGLAEVLFEPLGANLRQGYLLEEGAGRDFAIYDPLSRSRPAIESNEQNRYARSTLNVLIDALRDIIEYFCESGKSSEITYVQAWKTSRYALFRRFSVYVTNSANNLSASEKIQWLTAFPLFERESHHEIFTLIRQQYEKADDGSRALLVHKVESWEFDKGIELELGKFYEHARFSMLAWIAKSNPQCDTAKRAYSSALENYPDFKESAKPDFRSYLRMHSGEDETSTYTFEQLLSFELAEKFDELCSWTPKHQFDERTSFLAEVEKACDESSDWRDQMLSFLVNKGVNSIDLWRPVLSSISKSELTDTDWSLLLEQARLLGGHTWNANSLLSVLLDKARRRDGIPISQLLNVFKASETLWESYEEVIDDDQNGLKSPDSSDWYAKAINNFYGKIAELWVQIVSKFVNQDKESGMLAVPDLILKRLTSSLKDQDSRSTFALVILASEFNFFLQVAENWAQEQLWPYFDWQGRGPKVVAAWQGFLFHHSLSTRSLPILMASLPEAYQHLDQLGKYREQLSRLLAIICVNIPEDPYSHIHTFLDRASEQDAEAWADQIWLQLESMPENERIDQWDRWLEKYWLLRRVGKPKELRPLEYSRMYQWLLTSTYIFSKGVSLICETEAPSLANLFFLNDLNNSDFLRSNQCDVSRLLVHLARSEQARFDYEAILDVVKKILVDSNVTTSVKDDLRTVCKVLKTKQIYGASEVLDSLD